MFVDAFSDLTFTHMQVSTGTEETIEAKQVFERLVAQHGFTIKHYHNDNGTFCARAFTDELESCGQSIAVGWMHIIKMV